ncbi:C-5 cytosine-specific DNA methylase [Calothrix parasitica NIES-267]|uniref:C-5 cytosine-specific DNA methylase n=1 Tax=Calothrix parasitica NIES-267 TaxID=1973488 RepID=A0A1Z4LXW4_9CYAN|nr:C-5 cytosine-specific DNA methylase [Calothrix parasitica NIES-267]
MKEISDSDRWNPAHFGEMPRQLDSQGNPLIFWDDSIEPPEPDDYDTLTEYEEAWEKWEQKYSDSLTCAVELEPVSHSPELSQEKSNYADSVKSTRFVNKSCKNVSPVCQSTTRCMTSEFTTKKSTQLLHHHRVNLSALKENVWEKPTNETVSPLYWGSLTESNPSSSVSKTYPDYCRHPNTLEKKPEHIFNRCSGSFMNVGTMQNGLLSERNFASEPNGRDKDSYSLPRPGALSWSGKGRPPGTTKSEAKAKKLGLIGKKEVFNPEWLELQFGLPIGWTSSQEHQAATELFALVEQPLEIV